MTDNGCIATIVGTIAAGIVALVITLCCYNAYTWGIQLQERKAAFTAGYCQVQDHGNTVADYHWEKCK